MPSAMLDHTIRWFSRPFRALLPAVVAVALLMAATETRAEPSDTTLPQPQGPVILTITGAITRTNGDGVARFDRAMLEALPGRTAAVTTPWLSGVTTYEGPFGAAVLEAVGATGSTLQIRALNDYVAEIPAEDFQREGLILALRENGKIMSVRERGPVFLIYPFDLDPALNTETYYNRSVWQISTIEVE